MDENRELAERLQSRLVDAGQRLAVAESSTGGLVGSTITDIPGSSDYFDRSLVTYSNEAKMDLLGVEQSTLDAVGAVSAETAQQMAEGVRAGADCTWGLSTTGIAGPSGGTDEKPVGTVFVGVAYNGENERVSATRYEFDGPRLACKEQFTQQAVRDLLDAVESQLDDADTQ